MEGKSSDYFPINQGATEGCTLLSTLFLIYISGILCGIKERPKLGVKFSQKISGLLFSNDFVGIAKTKSALQRLINTVHNYSKCWHFEANVKKCAIVVFFKNRKVFKQVGLG